MLFSQTTELSLINIIDVHPLVPSIGSGEPTPKYLNQLKLLSTLSENSDLKDKYERYFSLVKNPFFGSTICGCITLIALTILFLGTVTGIAVSTAPLSTGALIAVIGLVAGFAANYFSSKRIKNAKSDLENHLNSTKSHLICLLNTEITNKKKKISEIIKEHTNIEKASTAIFAQLFAASKDADFAEQILEDFFSNEGITNQEVTV